VFKYKFDLNGYLNKFKARLCVRGDLQTTEKDNYAATLAIRYFRTLMAMAAAFDLEIVQLDALNAFLNSDIDEEITVDAPPGYPSHSKVLLLQKALYGLKQAPLLWHNYLTRILINLGLKSLPGINCVLANDWMIFFFYVDDIILLYDKQNQSKFELFLANLQGEIDLRLMDEANWFLGIRIIRDRPRRRLWLCQDSYIDKVLAKFNLKPYSKTQAFTPFTEGLEPFDGKATADQIFAYQQRIGTVNFVAVMTRPDVAKMCSILGQFLRNPGPRHLAAADRLISYLGRTKHLAIQYSNDVDDWDFDFKAHPLEIYSDAAFADNTDRKSSDGYLFMLFGGPIDWKASKQTTVTTSSTEAELLALSRTAKELIQWQRFFDRIDFKLNARLSILCDNAQTIRLLKQNGPLLTTKLRHVDIHQHWLRQEVQQEKIDVEWVSTGEMKADGLTKPLPRQAFQRFIQQLNLQSIQAMPL